ncbi:MAG: SDR family oxidoreductase [Clostridiales bacterium]|nr:SDR family oxidoreductase [Clostridiales bacterium]
MSGTLLITGASSELGLALIEDVRENYDRIFAHYNHTPDKLFALKEKLGDKLVPVQADFSAEAGVQRLIAKVREMGLPISAMAHLPAQRISYERFSKKPWEAVSRALEVQLHSAYLISQAFFADMAKAKTGRAVFVLSSVVAQPVKYLADYTVVKFALLGLVKALAAEYAEKHVMVNAVSPSMMETRFLDDLPELAVRQSAENNPQKRNARVSDVVPTIRFLLSQESEYMTGQNLIISGGAII